MRPSPVISLLVVCLTACHPAAEPARDPGTPAPVAGPDVGTAVAPPVMRPGQKPGEEPEASRSFPARPEEAPLVRIRDALEVDSLLGRRVRVEGHCTVAGSGKRAGSWTLEDEGASIEVRGLVPGSCAADSSEDLTIFAQIEPVRSDSKARLLLRLPD